MAVEIRLRRMDAKKNPSYRIVVADSRAPRDGHFIGELGYYNPLTEDKTVKVDTEEAQKWVKNGIKPIVTVGRLFKASNVYKRGTKAEAEVGENEEV